MLKIKAILKRLKNLMKNNQTGKQNLYGIRIKGVSMFTLPQI